MFSAARAWGSALVLLFLLLGCEEDGTRHLPDDTADGGTGLPRFSDLTPGEWNEIVPGGETLCARGAPFKFWVYRGSSRKLTVNFFGGGACWNETTCREGNSSVFFDNVDIPDALINLGASPGIFDMTNKDNPVHGDTQILVPYCTGDIHMGESDVVYASGPDGYQVHHRGAINAKAVLSWIYENFKSPKRVLSTGCSAGGYGALVWGARLMHHYPGAKQIMLSDSAAGVITPEFFANDFPVWNARGSFPGWIDGFDRRTVDNLDDAYVAIANEYPGAVLAQYNTVSDGEQSSFYVAMGGKRSDWTKKMRKQMAAIHDAAPNFRTYIADGQEHCTLILDNFYHREVNGVRFVDWFRDLLSKDVADDVVCDDCK